MSYFWIYILVIVITLLVKWLSFLLFNDPIHMTSSEIFYIAFLIVLYQFRQDIVNALSKK